MEKRNLCVLVSGLIHGTNALIVTGLEHAKDMNLLRITLFFIMGLLHWVLLLGSK